MADEKAMPTEPASTGADLDEPIAEMKPVSETKTDAAPAATVFVNRVAQFEAGQSGYAISNDEVYATDPQGSGALSNPSQDATRDPGSGSHLGYGANPVDRVDIKDADAYDNVACQGYASKVVGPTNFAEDADVSTNFDYKRQYGLKGVSPGKQPKFGQVYKRMPVAISANKIIYARGQQDPNTVALDYPTRTMSVDGTAVVDGEDSVVMPKRGNYLINGITFKVENGVLTTVTIDDQPIPITGSDTNVIMYTTDHAKLHATEAEMKVSTIWKPAINKRLPDQIYSPIANGIDQPARHAMIAEDILTVDGALAYAAVKSMCEAYAYSRMLKGFMGGSKGSMRLAALMTDVGVNAIQNSEELPLWTAHTAWDRDNNGDNSIVNFLRLFQSPRRFNGYYGNLITQPTFQQVYRDALKNFDDGQFIIDTDTKKLLNNIFGWFKDDESKMWIGVSRVGIVSPYRPSEVFTYGDTPGGYKGLESIYHIVNDNMQGDGEVSCIGSPFFNALVRYFNEKLLPKLKSAKGSATASFEYCVPFEFATNKFTLAQFFIAEALSYAAEGTHDYINGAYKQFKETYGIDPFEGDSVDKLTSQDVLTTAAFRGLGVNPVLQEASEGLKLVLSDPEFCHIDVAIKNEPAANDTFTGMLEFHPAIGSCDADHDYRKEFLFPVALVGPMGLNPLNRIISIGDLKYIKSRDLPITTYNLITHVSGQISSTDVTVHDMDDAVDAIHDASAARMLAPGRFIPFSGLVEDGLSAGTVQYLALQWQDVVGVKRFNGRITPAPMGVLVRGNVTAAAGMSIDTDLDVVNIWSTTDTGGTSPTLHVSSTPMESYDILFVEDGDWSPGSYGQATFRNAINIRAGLMDQDDYETIIDDFGIYLDPDAGYALTPSVLATFSGTPTVGAQYDSDMSTMLWAPGNMFQMLEGVTAGAGWKEIVDQADVYHDDRTSLRIKEVFGLIDYAKDYWTRLGEKYAATIFADENLHTTNEFERENNIML